jgi:uncharacterized protein
MARRFALVLGLAVTSLLPASAFALEPSPAPAAAPAPPAVAEKTPYPTAHDAPLDAKAQPIEKTEVYTRYRVEFNGIRKDRVPGFLYVPNDGKPSHPAVLLQYGSGGNKKTGYIVALGQQFVGRGFVVLTIDAPFKGERRPPRGERGWGALLKAPAPQAGTGQAAGDAVETDDQGDQGGRFQWYCGDYSRAVDYLLTRPEVDRDRIGYAGVSWGAITGITFVAHDPRVKAMASIVGGGNFMGFIADKVEMPAETVRAAKGFDPVYHVARISPRPLLLLNVTKDQLVPRFFAESLHKAAGDGAKKVWIDTDHFFQGIDRYAVLEDVITFLSEGLRGTTPETTPQAAAGAGR